MFKMEFLDSWGRHFSWNLEFESENVQYFDNLKIWWNTGDQDFSADCLWRIEISSYIDDNNPSPGSEIQNYYETFHVRQTT